jgi:hypothetical protein
MDPRPPNRLAGLELGSQVVCEELIDRLITSVSARSVWCGLDHQDRKLMAAFVSMPVLGLMRRARANVAVRALERGSAETDQWITWAMGVLSRPCGWPV